MLAILGGGFSFKDFIFLGLESSRSVLELA